MTVSIIVAAAANHVIGINDDLPWRLSADLKRFKSLTMGHHLIMGRKTFESINRLLPGRTTVILTRNPDFRFPGALIAGDLEQALDLTQADQERFVVGGGEIYRQAIPLANKIYLTRVHAEVEGDTYLPEIPWDLFEKVSEESIPADDRNEFETSFQVYQRKE